MCPRNNTICNANNNPDNSNNPNNPNNPNYLDSVSRLRSVPRLGMFRYGLNIPPAEDSASGVRLTQPESSGSGNISAAAKFASSSEPEELAHNPNLTTHSGSSYWRLLCP
jgi:hypothetical protein